MPSWYPILLYQPLKLIQNCAFIVSDFVVSAVKGISGTEPSWHLILSYQLLNFIKNCAFLISDSVVSAVKVDQELIHESDSVLSVVKVNKEL